MVQRRDLAFVHVSDLHFGENNRFEGIPPADLGRALSEDVRAALAEHDAAPALLFIIGSGDFTQSARPAEFEAARAFLEAFAGGLGTPRERILLIPGNHDISWYRCKKVELDLQEQGDTNEERLRAALDNAKLTAFNEFAAKVTGGTGNSIRLPGGGTIANFPEHRVSFALLNSCEKESHRKADHVGFLGAAQVDRVMTSWKSADCSDWLKVIVVHHNPSGTVRENVEDARKSLVGQSAVGKLSEEQVDKILGDIVGFEGKERLRAVAEDCRAQVILHGHHHATSHEAFPWREGGGLTHVFSAGSWGLPTEGRPTNQANALNVILITRSSQRVDSVVMEYDADFRQTGRVERGAYVATRKGCEGQQIVITPSAGPPMTQQDAGMGAFVSEYRLAFQAFRSKWDLSAVGVVATGPSGRPLDVPLRDLFQPLRFGEGYDVNITNRGSVVSVGDLLRRTKPFVVRGPAGSGKTTWMRAMFHDLLSMNEALPLMIELRRLAGLWHRKGKEGAARSIDAYLEDWVGEYMGAGWQGHVTRFLRQPGGIRPILFVDGWDELGDLGDELREKLVGFTKLYPRVLVVVSSRPYGQGKPSHSEGFKLTDVQPLSEKEIQEFAARFFQRCTEGDTVATGETSAGFRAALARSPEATILARTPLLLTMMLLISRASPLPDKRHLLYQKCIESLLAALPDRKEEEGALLSRHQWRPVDSEERLRVVAALAHEMQKANYHGWERRTIVVTLDELEARLPGTWKAEQRRGFVNWLTEKAGLIVDRADGTYSFSHLSFQEYLAAWHLTVTVEGNDNRIRMCQEALKAGRPWMETLRLWGALTGGFNPSRLDATLSGLLKAAEVEFWLAGAMFADGLGSKALFEQWLEQLPVMLDKSWEWSAEEAGRAWGASANNERREIVFTRVRSSYRIARWTTSIRLREWGRIAGFDSPLPHHENQLAQAILELADPNLKHEWRSIHIVAARVFFGVRPDWPADYPLLGFLRRSPNPRLAWASRLQLLASLGGTKAELAEFVRRQRNVSHRSDELAEVIQQVIKGDSAGRGKKFLKREGVPEFVTDLCREAAMRWSTQFVELQLTRARDDISLGRDALAAMAFEGAHGHDTYRIAYLIISAAKGEWDGLEANGTRYRYLLGPTRQIDSGRSLNSAPGLVEFENLDTMWLANGLARVFARVHNTETLDYGRIPGLGLEEASFLEFLREAKRTGTFERSMLRQDLKGALAASLVFGDILTLEGEWVSLDDIFAKAGLPPPEVAL